MNGSSARTAHVGIVSLINVSLSGIVQIGDCAEFEPVTIALAVQRELDHSIAGEADFKSYKVFSLPLPEFSRIPFLADDLHTDNLSSLTKTTTCPAVHVGSIHAIDTGTSSLIKAGNISTVKAVSRTMQIRQFAYRRMGMR